MSRQAAALLFFGIMVAVVIQMSIVPLFLRPSFKPDLLLVIVVFIALRGTFETGIILAWSLGMVEDVFGGLYLGLCATSFLVTFLIIRSVSDRLYADSALLFVLTVAGATIASFTVNLLFILLFTASPGTAYAMISDIMPRLLVNAFSASLVSLFPGFERKADVA
jgi:rod shape-determining protein MreD